MRHRASLKFWHAYRSLPSDVQRQAVDGYRLLKQNPRHPSLHFKKIGRFWSVRVGLHYRALAIPDQSDLIWFWIGTHADYDQLLKQA